MPFTQPPVARTQKHTRRLEFQAYEREDGLWDIEARISDVKPFDCPLESGVRRAGVPIHDMSVRVTFDRDFTIVEAEAASTEVAYPGYCDLVNPAYAKLVGLNLLKSFRRRVSELFGGVEGCTHITELLSVLPSAAIQANFQKPLDDATKPFQLDRCHALVTKGPAVMRYYPKWFVGGPHPTPISDHSNPARDERGEHA